MSITILLTTIPSLAVSAGMVLLYGEGAVEAWGVPGAALLVAGALAVVLVPIGAFVSYLLRYVFINQYTLPADGFVLGPEEPEVLDAPDLGEERGRARGAA